MPRSRLSSIAVRLALGVAIVGCLFAIPGAVGTVAQLGSLAWTLLLPLGFAIGVSGWRFGAPWWGGVAWLMGLLALGATARFQAWCMGGAADLAGAWWPCAVLCGFVVLGCGAFEHAARERVRLARREWAVRPMLFAAAMVVCIAGALAARGSEPSRELAVGAAASFPPLVLAALLAGISARALVRGPGRRPVCGWTALNTLCGYGTFALSCALMPPFSLLLLCAGSRRERLLRGGMRRWMRLVYVMTPTVRWSWSGHGSALVGRRVVVSNHESILDILSACALPGTRNLLAKTWVFRAPMLGLAARFAGIRNVDRLDPDDYLADARNLLGEREGVFVFPEGRRTRDGEVDRFRLGAFALAEGASIGGTSVGGAHGEVVPVAMAGGTWSIPAGQSWIQPGEVRSVVLPPMRREPDEPLRAFAARCRSAIVTVLHAARAELLPGWHAALQRRGWLNGLPRRMRAAALRESRAEGDRSIAGALAAACAASEETRGDWLLVGAGWGTAALCLRQIAPGGRLHAIESDGAKLRVAAHAWLRAGDAIDISDSAATPGLREPSPAPVFSGVVCHLPFADQRVASLLPRIAVARPAVVVVCVDARAWLAALPGYSRVLWNGTDDEAIGVMVRDAIAGAPSRRITPAPAAPAAG